MKYLELGASIYVPCTRKNLVEISLKNTLKAKSIIFCTEDSVSEKDLNDALINLQEMLRVNHKSKSCLKFIRVRNPDILKLVLQMENISSIDGFVLPKISHLNINDYMGEVIKQNHFFYIMPTLETREVFDCQKMKILAQMLYKKYFNYILSVRIGGNDLLNILGIRRSKSRTVYETPLNVTISNLVTIFKPYGFNLTAPVCELLADNSILNKEIEKDIEHGLFGKTAIHPDQISTIEGWFKPSLNDVDMAKAILSDDYPAVFGMNGVMCEKTTHSVWAKIILKRAEIYGIFGIE